MIHPGDQVYGDFVDISEGHEQIFAYTRSFENTTALVILNFGEEEVPFELDSERDWSPFAFVLGNYETERATLVDAKLDARDNHTVVIKGFEGRLYIRT
jgi:oligo-1,6-glucosidase